MHRKQTAVLLLLAAAMWIGGCDQKYDLVGRWDMGGSNFYFRDDGVVFYLAPSKTKYQGRYSYTGASRSGVVRAQLEAIHGGNQLSFEFLVTFLGPDRVQFQRASGGRSSTMLAARMGEPGRP